VAGRDEKKLRNKVATKMAKLFMSLRIFNL
jgi:hypothetical protein